MEQAAYDAGDQRDPHRRRIDRAEFLHRTQGLRQLPWPLLLCAIGRAVYVWGGGNYELFRYSDLYYGNARISRICVVRCNARDRAENGLFGVNVLGVTTAVGGGMIRDLILGITPPVMFQDASYALAAVATSTILFFIVYIRQQLFSGSLAVWYDRIMLICDTIGLGIFTVVGSSAAIDAGYGDNRFLIVFVGVLTGVGGGMIRDMMAGTMPYIFVKHIYAVASLAGGLLFALIYPYLPRLGSMMTGAVFVMLLRYFAARYRWNLPRIR